MINTTTKGKQAHSTIIENDQYWDVSYTGITLNVDCTITKLSAPDSNGYIETFVTKNKTNKGFIVSVKKEL